ncbi:MAG TPA: cytochrome c peroxidase [Ideonella sp.]|nr:cytochrome c peroxidase [Ideonella sp.]
MRVHWTVLVFSLALGAAAGASAADAAMGPTKEDQKWLLPKLPPAPADNQPNAARIELGKQLFFDPRLSSERNLACASCHNPLFGWSDGLPTAKGFKSKVLGRASPTVVNAGYTSLQMWDGRRASLEDQAMGPMESMDEMAMNLDSLFKWLNSNAEYKSAFAKAYPGEAIDKTTTSKAIAAFERTIVSRESPFDRWLQGDKKAMTAQQVRGFRLFVDPNKGNCAICHSAPNFTDGGFHNVGLASYGNANPDVGRFAIKPLPSLKGAFKTPTLRDIALTAPYFHDGSASTLTEVVEHYNKGGVTKDDLSPNIKALNLSQDELKDIVLFMEALTTPTKAFTLPRLPAN